MFKRHVIFMLSMFVFLGCSSKKQEPVALPQENEVKPIAENVYLKHNNEIFDLVNIPQDVEHFIKNINEKKELCSIQKKFEKNYFSVWNMQKPPEPLESVMWPFRVFKEGESYGENFQPLPKSFFDEMIHNADFDSYGTLNLYGITVKESSMRAFPTIRPLLKDPSLAGEGFPFDYLQNTTIHANEPILISHYSKDKEWAFVFTSYASGWIHSGRFAVLEKRHTDKWQMAKQVTITKENEPIYDEKGEYLFKSKVGMMFALIAESDDAYTILTTSTCKGSKPVFIRSKISKETASKDILHIDAKSMAQVLNEVAKTNYGWGGLYGQRDCSSMLRDMFMPFGIWLPRNSSQQSVVGEILSLEGLSDEQKIRIIKEKGVPFETLLYKKGHIVLYVGTYNDEIVIFHNTWGIKTKKNGFKGRVVIGKAIFSSLRLGQYQEEYDEESEILRNLISMNILTR